jgi:phosphoenolpyruvate-protein kinase (PTS system EI component)
VIETPAAVFGAAELCTESDFFSVGLDSLQQYVLAADRDHPELAERFTRLHRAVLLALRVVHEAATESGTPLSVFGVTAATTANLPLLLGLGFERLCVAPVALDAVLDGLRALHHDQTRRALERALDGE